jgi:DNA polymerase III subunit delta
MIKLAYALIGDDVYLQLQAIASIARELPASATRAEFDGESAELATVLDELRSFAMFGGEDKLVIVRDADDFVTKFRENLEAYVANPSRSATLILRLKTFPKTTRLYKAIDKIGQIILCEPPSMNALPGWITKHAKADHGIDVTPIAAQTLAELIGCDLGRLDNELAKLALQTDDGRIDVKHVSGTVSFQREQEMSALTLALTAGDAAGALRRWRQLVDGDASAEFRAVTWLSGWLSDVNKAIGMRKKRLPDQVIAKSCRVWDFKMIKPFLATVDALGEAGAARAVDLLAEVDHRTKSGLGDAIGNVERFIVSLANSLSGGSSAGKQSRPLQRN